MARAGLTLTGAVLAMLVAMALKGVLIALPAVPDAPQPGRFDANRAAARLERILGDGTPHPIDSAAEDALRVRLVAEMRAVGLEPRVADDFACNGIGRGRYVACARTRNLVATIGPDTGRRLLLAAHYDSTFAGPGAADDGIGVATLLEVAAQLRGARLARPVSFLLTDGEEMGLIGARAFHARDPLAGEVDSLLNFEARGVTGPAIMFETSRPNGRAIAAFAAAAPRPLANSLTTDLYGLIPNSTDVAVFDARPWTILNFAIIGNETRYHSAGDTLAALDRRSLQHMGDQALALSRELAAGAPGTASGERLYMDLLGRKLVTLPLGFGLGLGAVLLLFFLIEAVRRGALRRPFGAMAIAFVGAPALAWVGQALLGILRAGDYWRGHPIVTDLSVYASAIAAGLIALALIAPDAERTKLRAAFWFVFMLAGAAIATIAPGGAVFFLAPPLVAALGMAIGRRRPAVETGAAWLAIGLLYLSFGPALALFEELMSNGPHWIFAPIGAAMLLPVLIEASAPAARLPRSFAPALAAILLLAGWGAVALTPAYTADREQQFAIEYVRDPHSRWSRWAVNNDGAALPYPGSWQRDEMPYSSRRRWVAPAPTLPVAAPEVERGHEAQVGPGRLVTLELRTNGAESLTLIVPRDAELAAAGVDGFMHEFDPQAPGDHSYVRCVGRSCDGARLELVFRRAEPVVVTLVGSTAGLPAAADALVRGRPALARPQYAPDSTITLQRIRL